MLFQARNCSLALHENNKKDKLCHSLMVLVPTTLCNVEVCWHNDLYYCSSSTLVPTEKANTYNTTWIHNYTRQHSYLTYLGQLNDTYLTKPGGVTVLGFIFSHGSLLRVFLYYSVLRYLYVFNCGKVSHSYTLCIKNSFEKSLKYFWCSQNDY